MWMVLIMFIIMIRSLIIWLLGVVVTGLVDDNADPFNFQQKLTVLANDAHLQFLPYHLTTTVNNNPIFTWVLTALPASESMFKGHTGAILTSFMHSRQIGSLNFLRSIGEELILRYKQQDQQVQYLLNHTVVFFVPYVNIDGVLYVKDHFEGGVKDGRKNMNFQEYEEKFKRCHSVYQKGVDVNRNFDYKFGTMKNSSVACGEEFRGAKPFSERESQAIKLIYDTANITLAIDVHSFGNVWIYPYASEDDPATITKHPLYPIYQNIFSLFAASQLDYLNCKQALEYTADGVYIDWAVSRNALSFAFEVGDSFVDPVAKPKPKYIDGFIEVMKVNSFNYDVYKGRENNLCVRSMSRVSFGFTLAGQYHAIAPQEQLCFDVEQSQTIAIQIANTTEKQIIQLRKLPEKPAEQESQSEWSWIWYIFGSVFLFYVGGLLCGLSTFCEKLLGVQPMRLENEELANFRSPRVISEQGQMQ